ncbi:response regulator [Spirochaeta isovalerica]|uniref:DNA-binding response OmpR family regulator n=1 Tax=Spirochaeta isovalerica TaxID=150 RepID=A0A841R0M7_9SPIO|nr:response regulator [Spirochaeta isovalerica]MBB6478494.1 DNA-binding response OmpR family regulator [Spirochaeta isovalerica]
MTRILIIDDDPTIRFSLSSHFSDYDYEVYEADDASEGLEIMEKEKVDAVIVDLRMPGISGDQFIRNIYETYEGTVFLIHTGSTEFTLPDELAEYDRVSNRVFLKPVFDLEEMNREIETLLKKG